MEIIIKIYPFLAFGSIIRANIQPISEIKPSLHLIYRMELFCEFRTSIVRSNMVTNDLVEQRQSNQVKSFYKG